tara:strand:- start:9720 stop:9902 length:183 start_codon:yes stop_codon:yes gene_type:complete
MIINNFEVLHPDVNLNEVKIRCFNSKTSEELVVYEDITGIPFHAVLLQCVSVAQEWENNQ